MDENARVCRFTGVKVVKQTRHFSDPPGKHQAFPADGTAPAASLGAAAPVSRARPRKAEQPPCLLDQHVMAALGIGHHQDQLPQVHAGQLMIFVLTLAGLCWSMD